MVMVQPAFLLILMLLVSHLAGVLARSHHNQWTCSHRMNPNDVTYRVHLPEYSKRHRRTATLDQALRIFIYYDDSVDLELSANLKTRLKDYIVPKMVQFFENSLKVRGITGSILLDQDCTGNTFFITDTEVRYCVNTCAVNTTCGTVTVPPSHLKRCGECNGNNVLSSCTITGSDGEGVSNADFVAYISAKEEGSCGPSSSTIAFAGACQMEDEYDRPIAGYINFCPDELSSNSDDDFILDVAKHEILHALAISNGLYPWWRDSNGQPRSERDQYGYPLRDSLGQYMVSNTTILSKTYTDWDTRSGNVTHTVSLLVTPAVVAEGRRYFGCESLVGVQLEDQGGSGTAGSHWEKRILEPEIMTGVIADSPVFSHFTFAALEDSGWYQVNYSYAGQLIWGRNTGCELPAGSCGGYIKSQQTRNESIFPFCNHLNYPSITGYGCTADRLAVSYCGLTQYVSAFPTEYQYFTSGNNFDSSYADLDKIGGRLAVADYCPYQTGFTNGFCDDINNQRSGLSNAFAETYETGSRCVEHGGTWTAQGNGFISMQSDTRSGCYKYTCSSGGVVTIHILDHSYICDSAGEVISVTQTSSNGITYAGSIKCPSCLDICYDDVVNCPEAASLYSDTLGPASGGPSLSITSATTAITSSLASSTTISASVAVTSPTPVTDPPVFGSGDGSGTRCGAHSAITNTIILVIVILVMTL